MKAARCLAALLLACRADEQFVVQLEGGSTRAAGRRDLPAYESYTAGRAAHARGDEAAAVAHYERAVALKPDLPEAHINLGQLVEAIAARAPADAGAFDAAVARARAHLSLIHI